MIEVKRDVDRAQLAQTLEYAGWARTTNLDELAGLYHGGPVKFWDDWPEFTKSVGPVLVQRDPRHRPRRRRPVLQRHQRRRQLGSL